MGKQDMYITGSTLRIFEVGLVYKLDEYLKYIEHELYMEGIIYTLYQQEWEHSRNIIKKIFRQTFIKYTNRNWTQFGDMVYEHLIPKTFHLKNMECEVVWSDDTVTNMYEHIIKNPMVLMQKKFKEKVIKLLKEEPVHIVSQEPTFRSLSFESFLEFYTGDFAVQIDHEHMRQYVEVVGV